MRKISRIILIIICIAAFASLIVFSADVIDDGVPPKAPLSAEYKTVEPQDNGPVLLVTLHNYKNVDSIVVFFGNELGKFENELGRFSVEGEEVRCELNVTVQIPEKSTKLWIYSENKSGLSAGGCSVDMFESFSRARVGGADAPDNNNLEAYAITVIIAAVVISSVGYIFLRDPSKKDDGEGDCKE